MASLLPAGQVNFNSEELLDQLVRYYVRHKYGIELPVLREFSPQTREVPAVRDDEQTDESTPKTGHTEGESDEFSDIIEPYPASPDKITASKAEKPTKKWSLYEEDKAIKHFVDVMDEGVIHGEERFCEAVRRLEKDGIYRTDGGLKNFWHRKGRSRSGRDERRNKNAPLATSLQGKAARKQRKSNNQSSVSTTKVGKATIGKTAVTKPIGKPTASKKSSRVRKLAAISQHADAYVDLTSPSTPALTNTSTSQYNSMSELPLSSQNTTVQTDLEPFTPYDRRTDEELSFDNLFAETPPRGVLFSGGVGDFNDITGLNFGSGGMENFLGDDEELAKLNWEEGSDFDREQELLLSTSRLSRDRDAQREADLLEGNYD